MNAAVLGIAPGDEDAIRCKVVALIKNDSIEDALSAIQSSKNFPVDFGFYKVRVFKHMQIVLIAIGLCLSSFDFG